jgi:hypothetical protein
MVANIRMQTVSHHFLSPISVYTRLLLLTTRAISPRSSKLSIKFVLVFEFDFLQLDSVKIFFV